MITLTDLYESRNNVCIRHLGDIVSMARFTQLIGGEPDGTRIVTERDIYYVSEDIPEILAAFQQGVTDGPLHRTPESS